MLWEERTVVTDLYQKGTTEITVQCSKEEENEV